MLKTLLQAACILIPLIYAAKIKISFSPFRFSFSNGWEILSIVIMCTGFVMYSAFQTRSAYRQGMGDAIEQITKIVDDKITQVNP